MQQALNPLQTRRITKRQAVKTDKPGPCSRSFPTGLIVFVGWYLESESKIGIYITLYKSPPCHSFHTSKVTGTHQEQLLDHLRVLLVFLELNILLYIMISRHRRQQNPAPAQPASPPPPPPRKRRKTQNPWVMPWILQREERRCYRTLLDELITTDIPSYRNFTRMEPAFIYLIGERITPHLRKSITNFRKPLEVGLKLAVTLRHLSTGKTYTSLQYHWRVGRTTIFKFVPQVCKAILKEFQHELLDVSQ